MVLHEHCQHVFCVPRPPVPTLPCERLQDMPFSVEELANAFAKVRLHKAVGPHSMPPALVRALSEPLAEHCHALLSQLWLVEGLIIPSCWKHAWLTLLAKRTVKSPKDIRLIALTDLLGKTVLSLIVVKAKRFVLCCPLSLFLHTYPKRATTDALILAFAHFRTTRQACQQASSTVWQRRDGGRARSLAGGCCLSLDLSTCSVKSPLPHCSVAGVAH